MAHDEQQQGSDGDVVTLRWERSYLVREHMTYELEVPRALAEKFLADPDVSEADQYVVDNSDPTDEWSDHVENRDLTGTGSIIT